MKTNTITDNQVLNILQLNENHFTDLKSKDIQPKKLSKSISAFANSAGGELYIGVKEIKENNKVIGREWEGFENEEEANGCIQLFSNLFPLGENISYNFLVNPNQTGLVLQVLILKTKDIITSSDSTPYIRRGAQSLPVNSPELLDRLKLDKGVDSFENRTLDIDLTLITDSIIVIKFLIEVVPSTEAEPWLKKQILIKEKLPTVAGVLLFSDTPQAILPKQSGIKIYRYSTKGEPTRETLAFDPLTIEGPIYDLIYDAVDETVKIVESISILTEEGLDKTRYPKETLHEIITNAVLHRDYSIPSDIHIRIFDNRIEIENPGKLPGHITIQNILHEQFARNGTIVRLINKFPNPPNKDVGEGLNTAFDAMKKLRLKTPIINEKDNTVLVIIKHESLASSGQFSEAVA